jgi:hypothetical protein
MANRLYFTLILAFCFLGRVRSQACPNDCNAHGRCLNTGLKCQCFEGYTGGDCSLYTCPTGPAWSDLAQGVDNAHNLAECSNMGLCDRSTGLCTCRSGFAGEACERRACTASTATQCNGAGRCLSMSEYAISKDPGYGAVYKYDGVWDASKMYGCVCDDKYSGPECTLRVCPTGDDPLTGVGANTAANPVFQGKDDAGNRLQCQSS